MWFSIYGIVHNPTVWQMGFNFLWNPKYRVITVGFLTLTFYVGFEKKDLTLIKLSDIMEALRQAQEKQDD